MSAGQQALVTPANSAGNSNYDPYYSNVSLLMSMNGSNGSTTFPDASQNRLTITANGNAQISTAQNKFGGSSAYFDGTGDYLTIPDSSAFDFPGDFTIECWAYLASTGQQHLYEGRVGSTTNSLLWYINGFTQLSAYINGSVVITGSSALSTGQWYHLAFSRASNTVYLFVNGVSVATPVSNSISIVSPGNIYIGTNDIASGSYVTGYIDDLRITKGVARYTATFTPPLYANPRIGPAYDPFYNNVSLLLGMNGSNGSTYFPDNSGNPKTMTANFNAQVSTAQWKWGSSSAYFDGSGDSISTPYSSEFTFDGDFTIEAWINPPVVGGQLRAIAGIWPGGDPNVCSWIFTVGDNLRFTYGIGGTNANIDGTSSATIPNRWNHVAVTRQSTTVRLFLNGQMDPTTATVSGSLNTSSASLCVGAANTSNLQPFTGYIDDLRITKGVARYTANFAPPVAPFANTGPTVDPYYDYVSLLLPMNGANASTSFIDSSKTSKVVTANADAKVSTTQWKWGGSSAYFDGTGDYLSTPTSTAFDFGSGDLTIEAWVYIAANSSPDIEGVRAAVICNAWGVNPSGWKFSIDGNTTTTGTGLSWDTWNSTATAGTLWRATGSISQGTWHHVAATVSGGTRRLFLNGVLLSGSTITVGAGYTEANTNGNSIYVGKTPTTNYQAPLNGYIDDLRITKGVARYTANFTVPAQPNPITGVQYDNYYDNVILLLNGDGANSGTSIIDSSSYSRAPSIRNAQTVTSTTQYKYGTASIYLNATTQQLAYATTSLWNLTGFDWTIEMWFYHTGGSNSLLSRRDTNVSFASGWVLTTAGVRANINDVFSNTQMSWTGPAANTWHHIAWTLNGTTMRAFLNGVLVATKSGVTQINDQGNSIFFGSASNAGENLFQGYIDNFRWTRGIARYTANFTPPTQALPSQGPTTDPFYYNTSLLLHMNSTNGSTVFTDTSPVPKNVTPAGNAQISTAQFKYGGSSAYFDGSGDNLTIPNSTDFSFGTNDFTIELWFYIAGNSSTNLGGNRSAALITTNGSGTPAPSVTTGWELNIVGNTTTTGTGLDFTNFVSGTNYSIVTAVSIAQTTWHHIAVSRSGTTTYIFLNGVSLTSGALTNQSITTSYPIYVGSGSITGYLHYLNGYIDDLRITKGIARYMNNFTPPQRQFPDQ